MPPSKTQRWLDLLAFLVGRRTAVPVDAIMENVPAYRDRWESGDERSRAAVRRMFERDKDELRRLGVPLERERVPGEPPERAEGYRVPRSNFYLPYLVLVEGEADEGRTGAPPGSASPSGHAVGRVTLSEEEARTATLALRTALTLPSFPFRSEARTALRKLTFDLDPSLAEAGTEEAGPASPPPVRILDRPGGADPEGALGTLLDALYDRRRVRFRYHSIGRDATEDREVEPWGLLFQWGAWYVAAHDPQRGGPRIRLFRTDRMREVRPARSSTSTAEFEVPDDFDLRAFAGREAWELAEEEDEREVLVRFRPPTSLLAARNGWGELHREEEGGATIRAFSVRRLAPFLRWVLSMAGEAEVTAPREATEALASMAEQVADLYREDG